MIPFYFDEHGLKSSDGMLLVDNEIGQNFLLMEKYYDNWGDDLQNDLLFTNKVFY